MPNLSQFNSREEFNQWYRDYFKKEKWKKYHREHLKSWRVKNSRQKDNIRIKVHRAVKSGKLKKLPCEVCGEVKVEGHHDDYSKPLEVKWLCSIHHRERDLIVGTRKK